jgi:hypothetical protein
MLLLKAAGGTTDGAAGQAAPWLDLHWAGGGGGGAGVAAAGAGGAGAAGVVWLTAVG